MVSNTTEYQREYMRTYYTANSDKINRQRVLNRARRSGRIPKQSAIDRYGFTDAELASIIAVRFQDVLTTK